MRFVLTVHALLIVSITTFGNDADKPTKRSFEVTVDSEMKMEGIPGMNPLNAFSRFRYSYERSKQVATLAFDEIQIDVKMDGKDFVKSLINRKRFRYETPDGKGIDFTAENAPPQMKTLLEESYGVPFVAFELDANGKETGRKILGSKVAQKTINLPTLANARIFHVPYFPEKVKWNAPVEIGASVGGNAKGTLQYEKQATNRGRVIVKVSGELKLDELAAPDGKWQIRGKHTVVGEQVYDEVAKEWISGEWKTELTMDGTSEGKPIANGKGKLVVKMKFVE